MRLRLLILSLLLLVALPLSAQERAFAWQGKGADGQAIRFDPAHMQRPAVLLFWATWCPYCKALMPNLQQVYDAAGKGKLDVYAIDIKDDGDPAGELRERKQTFTLVRDGDSIADQYGVKGTPGLFLIDVKGNIIYNPLGGTPEKIEGVLREKLHLAPSKEKREKS